jgi:type IV pilus assembly protein PilC
MKKFRYKVILSNGQIEEGEMEVADKTALFNAVSTNGSSLIYAEESEKKIGLMEKINEKLATVKMHEKITFARNLSAMMSAGLSVSRAISVMRRQTKNAYFRKVLGDIEADIKKGQSLSEAFKRNPKVWGNLFVSMVKAGEESGDLSKSLAEISNQMEKTYMLQKKVKGAMMYPAIIVGVMLIIGVLMLIYVVPTLTSTFSELDVDLPASTQIVIFTSDFMKNNFLTFLALIALIFGSFYMIIKSAKGKSVIDYLLPRMPLIGNLVRESNSAKTARTLSSLLFSGVEVLTALSITKEVIMNVHYKSILDEAASGIQKGAQISGIFEKHQKLYPIFVAEMTAVGEETGKLSDMLEKVAIYYENEIEQQTKNLSTIIEPILMVLIGAAVGFFAVSMIMPMYSLVNGL